jgi:hypothetical protein
VVSCKSQELHIIFDICNGCNALINEHSSLYLFGEPVPLPPAAAQPPTTGLTPEEQEIYKRLHDKVDRVKSTEELDRKEVKEPIDKKLLSWYKENMSAIQQFIN